MRLLRFPTKPGEQYRLEQVPASTKIPYIAISHVWMDPGTSYEHEILFHEFNDPGVWKTKPDGAAKIKGACDTARSWSARRKGFDSNAPEVKHIWLDTCCVDQKNSVELTTAINSMYRWYQNATTCFVYLSDIEKLPGQDLDLSKCRWWTRGWTLQELVASSVTEFFDRNWTRIGDKKTLQSSLTAITKIGAPYLADSKMVSRASVAHRMSWAAGRQTRQEEDMAYSLMGIFGVQMPTLYGEGRVSAFRRLQEEIVKYSNDHSIFAWNDEEGTAGETGLLAPSANCFKKSGAYVHTPTPQVNEPFSLTNKGLSIVLPLQKHQMQYIASIDCPVDAGFIGVYLEFDQVTGVYRRVRPGELCKVLKGGRGQPQRLYVRHRFDM
ncbi:hypothetical protein H2200_002292 [Cladophialophora chaetospira]|uniref:Heterokaryon incompatibility domain-containing protein n=1 Tax=Cladophialophora chaetospira TaxID=386627 RepID=A0AA38XJI8_9EURO|nr:hypothetical protein H2200_002292 [Cladophialophora chaetospira]